VFAEKDGTFTNTERRVQRVRKAVEPPGEARLDWQILSEVATRMGYGMRYPDIAATQDEMASLIPQYRGILEVESGKWKAEGRSGLSTLHSPLSTPNYSYLPGQKS